LHTLSLSGSKVGDAGFKQLVKIVPLKSLTLNNTDITCVNLKELAKSKHLETLSLVGAKITDPGLKSLGFIRGLKVLYLYDNKITDAAVAQLQKQLPGCQILWKRPTPGAVGPVNAVKPVRVPTIGGPESPKN
jgi:hypothetical protein